MTTIYVGSYTEGTRDSNRGISLLNFDDSTGKLTFRSLEESGPNPSFLTISRDGAHVYAVNETDDGAVSSLRRDPLTGALTYLGSQLAHGAAPCFVGFDPSGDYVLVANYNGGTIAVFPIGQDGKLEPASEVVDHATGAIKPRRDTPVHPHMIAPTPDGNFIMVTDLGLDATLLYRLQNGKFSLRDDATALAKIGAGPRHFAFSPDGATAYVINELDSTLDVFAYSDGVLSRRQTISSLPDGFKGRSSCAQVLVSDDGRFVYGSNRGHDSIATWPVRQPTGEVGAPNFVPSGGKTPRNFAIDPSGRWLITAHQDSNNLFVFARDKTTGGLTRTDHEIEVHAPVCVVFAP
jgi:6-phosphogluconolactonase